MAALTGTPARWTGVAAIAWAHSTASTWSHVPGAKPFTVTLTGDALLASNARARYSSATVPVRRAPSRERTRTDSGSPASSVTMMMDVRADRAPPPSRSTRGVSLDPSTVRASGDSAPMVAEAATAAVPGTPWRYDRWAVSGASPASTALRNCTWDRDTDPARAVPTPVEEARVSATVEGREEPEGTTWSVPASWAAARAARTRAPFVWLVVLPSIDAQSARGSPSLEYD
mmetsp:Transcript_16348/g.51158  ORF Transcript_16348/g.51158 Transcript_16348/m.51158 type:complete len:230 (+) Transcript_16348:191-880(+)